jgi:SOS response regulatory protein OraA/RecX
MIKKITEKRLENITLYYLQRYESCSSKLRIFLKRRILKLKIQQIEIPSQIDCWIENVIEKMINLGYINDRRYIENTVRRLQSSGKSIRYISNKLKQDGIEDDLIQSFFEKTIQNCKNKNA